MADEAEVVVPEEGVVEIALEGGEPQKVVAEAVVDKSQPRKEASPELDEATKALQAAVDSERRLRTAAEQTAITARQQAERGALQRLAGQHRLESGAGGQILQQRAVALGYSVIASAQALFVSCALIAPLVGVVVLSLIFCQCARGLWAFR